MRLPLLSGLLILILGLHACGAAPRRGGGGGGGGGSDGEGEGEGPAEGEGEGEGPAEGEGEGPAEGEGEGPAEGEGEGPAEGEGEGPAEGEGEGPAEGEGEGPAEGEGEGEGPPCEPDPEVCNGADDDCDGQVDEDDPEIGGGCDTGELGPCWQGRKRCEGGELVCIGVVQPEEERCDGLDNDCDGEEDEGPPEHNEECETDQPGVCGHGRSRCENGILHCDPIEPGVEECNGFDDDCDGQTDEGDPGEEEPCDTGLEGICAVGVGSCTDGILTCHQEARPGVEECNLLDDDCDGETDEGLECRPTCSGGARLFSHTVDNDMALCKDESNQTCEQDFGDLCPEGWHLCTPPELRARNDGWQPGAFPAPALGVIRCRGGGGAGHYTVNNVTADEGQNCHWGSSLPNCVANYGCNEQRATAPSCGNGEVDHPEEGCDDGNDDDTDACLAVCYTSRC